MRVSAYTSFFLREPLMLGALLLASGGVWAFVELADEVQEGGDAHAMDERLILSLRDPQDLDDPVGPKWFEEMVRDITALGGVAVIILVAVTALVMLWVLGERREAALLLAALLGGFVLSMTMKNFFDRPRPDLTAHGSYVYTKSFPSGHAMVAASVYLTLGVVLAELVRPRALKMFLLLMAIFLTLAIGASRVYLGVHWPTDVLAGWAGGAAWALACWLVFRALHLRRIRIGQTPPQDAATSDDAQALAE